MAPTSILDAAYELIAGLPGGPTPAEVVALLSARFPDAAPGTLNGAVERAFHLKWRAYGLYSDVEKGAVTAPHARLTLRTEQPGFSEQTYDRAWADGRLGNAW